jgi:hypothetical protein
VQVLAHEGVDGIVLRYDMDAPGGRVLRNQIRHVHPDTPMLLFSDMNDIRSIPLPIFSEYTVHPELPDLAR